MTFHTIKVNDDPKFRRAVAKAIMAQSHPGYHSSVQGGHYADPVAGIVYLMRGDQCPWPDDVNHRIVEVELLVLGAGDYSGEVDWDIPQMPRGDMLAAYRESGGTEDWDQNASEVIEFARSHQQWKERIEEIEDLAHDETISLILDEILDEIYESD